MTPRQAEILELLKAKPMHRGDVAKALGCSPATAGQHLWLMKCQGVAHAPSRGRYALWVPGPAPRQSFDLLRCQQAAWWAV